MVVPAPGEVRIGRAYLGDDGIRVTFLGVVAPDVAAMRMRGHAAHLLTGAGYPVASV